MFAPYNRLTLRTSNVGWEIFLLQKSWRGGALTQGNKTPVQQLLTLFKTVNMFQKTLATVEPNIRVPFAAPIFNAAVISMASTSALSQVSGKQNEAGR